MIKNDIFNDSLKHFLYDSKVVLFNNVVLCELFFFTFSVRRNFSSIKQFSLFALIQFEDIIYIVCFVYFGLMIVAVLGIHQLHVSVLFI